MIDWPGIWNEDNKTRRPSPTRAILYLFSLLYRQAIGCRNRLYDRQILKSIRFSCPVISIGNITVGGTGKTPCVIGLARMLSEQGWQPAVISRGYKSRSTGPVNIVSDGKTILLDASQAGDEPLMIARSLPGVPVITGAKRRFTAAAAINRFGARVIICDDAFQHRQIFRDLDIVLVDAARPLGNGHLLPRGELREPAENLRRADCIILTRKDGDDPIHPAIARLTRTANIPVFTAAHRFKELAGPGENEQMPPDSLKGKKICAFAGIARPDSFRNMLTQTGAEILSFIDFPDHYAYNRNDLDALQRHFQTQNADCWITTEKDAMRLAEHPEFLKFIRIMRMDMEIREKTAFENFILARISKPETQRKA